MKNLRQAIDDCDQALTVFSPEKTPRYWKLANDRRQIAMQMLQGSNASLER